MQAEAVDIIQHQRRLILPKPISRKQALIIDAIQDPNLIELFVACGTKAGKSFGASCGVSGRLSVKNAALGRWIAPIYAQTKIGFRYCQKILPPAPEVEPHLGDLSLTFSSSATRLEFKSGQKPEDLEGEGTDVNILDEASKMKQQVYDSVKTTTTVTRGLVAPFSTPRGKNWFYVKSMDAKEIMEWQIKKGKPLTHIFITAPSTVNPLVTKEAIEEAQRALPDRLFRQYYLAEFVDDGTVFVGFRQCVLGPEISFEGSTQYWVDLKADEMQVVIGADWAKTKDRTVFWAIDVRTRCCCGFWRFYKTPYTEAIRRLETFASKFKDVFVVRHDKTGLGSVIDDYLGQTNLPAEGVVFTNLSKADMVARLITGFEQKDHFLPNWREAVDELDGYEVLTTPTGNMTYGAPEGKHDDIVSAMMLAYSGLVQYGDTSYEVRFTDGEKPKIKKAGKVQEGQGPERVSAIEKFYREVIDQTEDDD